MIKLKRSTETFTYRIEQLISEHELLRDYNARTIHKMIQEQLDEINSLYDLNMSHVIDDGNGSLCSVSTSVENLVIMLDEQRQRLAMYEKVSGKRLKTLKHIVDKYSPKDRMIIKQYFKDNVFQPNNQVIKNLRRDLFKIENARRLRRLEITERLYEIEINEHVNELKMKMAVT
ncbi:hypothetical protein AAA450_11720 [Staphylococcus equorum]|uniref:hypothetical protein n=1 Tax=Staphylococcus equorum TaxID=246432 RepID=UPI003D8096DD